MSKNDDEVLVRVEGVSKKFCRSLKKSLWYGVCDIASELLPVGKRQRVASSELLVASEEGRVAGKELRVTGAAEAVACSELRVESGNTSAGGASGPATRHQLPVTAPTGAPVTSYPPLVTSPTGEASLRDGEFFAVKDVSFELRRGECLGLIGHNGAGKTTLLKMLNGLIKPDSGSITMRGRVGALIALGAGFNPILTGRENIYINGSVLGLTKKEIDAKIDEIIDFADIGEFIDTPVQNYSSGMSVRLGFAVATTLDPDVLILDEVLAVGDAAFRAKCYARISEIASKAAIIFVSHNMEQVTQVCSKGILLVSGTVHFYGDSIQAADIYSNLASKHQGPPEENEHVSQIVKFINVDLSKYIEYGGNIDINLEISLEKKVKNADLHISLSNISRQVVSRVYTKLTQNSFELHSGLNIINAKIGPNYLSGGVYTISIALLDQSNNEQIYWGNHIKQISVSGSSAISCACVPPIKIKVA